MIIITIVITMMVITISWRSFQISWRFAAQDNSDWRSC